MRWSSWLGGNTSLLLGR
jgi:hypothetical protein